MKLKSMLLSLAMVAVVAPAVADDKAIDLSSGFASFGNSGVLLPGGDDVISFVNLAAGTYDFAVTVSSQFISNLGGSFNGTPLQVSAFGPFQFAFLQGQEATPLALTVTGSVFTSPLASYSVTISATPVPEPGTLALMLAGIGAVGFLARRRNAV